MTKIKYKRKKKSIKLKYLLLILPIFLISLGIAYAKLSTNLTIFGKVVSVEGKYPPGKSLYTYSTRSTWPSTARSSTLTIHDVYVPILNLDEDYKEKIEIQFDITDGFLPEESTNNCNIWQAESVTKVGNRVTVTFKDYACWVLNGSTIDLYFQFPYLTTSNAEVKISNLTLNGKLATYVTELP